MAALFLAQGLPGCVYKVCEFLLREAGTLEVGYTWAWIPGWCWPLPQPAQGNMDMSGYGNQLFPFSLTLFPWCAQVWMPAPRPALMSSPFPMM